MKLKNSRQSTNVEDRRGEKAKPVYNSNTAERDKAPVAGWDSRLGGQAGTRESAKRLSQLWDSAKPSKLKDGVYPKPHKTVETESQYRQRITKAGAKEAFPTEFD